MLLSAPVRRKRRRDRGVNCKDYKGRFNKSFPNCTCFYLEEIS